MTQPAICGPGGLDLSYVNAVPVLPRKAQALNLVLVGCGGTGGWLAPDLARLAREFRSRWPRINLMFVDPDIVEPVNIPRQNFCHAEIGLPKAETLAARYGAAWGVEIAAVTDRFSPEQVSSTWNTITVLVGCVDNAAARKSIAPVLDRNGDAPSVWWLDCGNGAHNGQVLLGSAASPQALACAFVKPTFCTALPSPTLQHPELLEPRPEELHSARLSCAEMAAANRQALTVNKEAAAHAASALVQFLGGSLRYFALYFDQASGTARSRYITPDSVAAAVGLPPDKLFARPKNG